MSSAAYYPAGAYNDPRAPYNQVPQQEEEFTIEVSSTITRTADIKSDEWEWNFDQPDFIGDAVSEFKEQCYSIKELLNILFNYLMKDLKTETDKHTIKHIRHLIDEVQAWEYGDEEIEEA